MVLSRSKRFARSAASRLPSPAKRSAARGSTPGSAIVWSAPGLTSSFPNIANTTNYCGGCSMNETLLEIILARLPSLTIGVIGDLFLDRYLDLDAALTEPSVETGLDAYQVIRVRSSPGAAGTVINN